MKHHADGRPVGRCKGCCLNLKTLCAGRLEPRAQWSRGRCKSFGDRSMLEAYYHPIAPTGAKAAKLARRAKAVQMATQPHYDGHKITSGILSPPRRTVTYGLAEPTARG